MCPSRQMLRPVLLAMPFSRQRPLPRAAAMPRVPRRVPVPSTGNQSRPAPSSARPAWPASGTPAGALTRSTQASVCRSSASPSSPGGSWRTQTVWSTTGPAPASPAPPHLLGEPLRVGEVAPQPRWMPDTPSSRIRNHSFSARKRRPSGMPQSRRFFTGRRPRSADSWDWCSSRGPGARVAHVVERAIERGAQPLVRVETSESAASMPCHIQRHSGRTIAEPAMAASTCSQSPCRRAISRSPRGVERRRGGGPVVATTAQGMRPAADRPDRLLQRVRRAWHSVVHRDRRTLSRPKPASSAAFSTELWLCTDV